MNNRERELLIWISGVIDTIEDEDGSSELDSTYIKIPRKTFDRIKTAVRKVVANNLDDKKQLLKGNNE